MAKKVNKEELYEHLSLELRRGVLVLAVLNQLQSEQYGYSLKQSLSKQGLDINEGTLYPLLRRLESKGLLESSWQVVDDARPRRYYHISAAGETILANLQTDWQLLVGVMDGILSTNSEGY
ncbi:MAG: PadR family transcriptional regulator [Chloroflexi bacterium]|nr:MAG: PadR family transcriptional regulator [Chloroflexota bacterium]